MLEVIAAALDIAIDHATSAERIEDEPTMSECAEVFLVALQAQGYRVERI